MKKILFTDLDGTLLKNDKTISKRNREAISSMVAAGHYIVPTTGRSVPGAMAVVGKTGFDDLFRYLIAYNGAVVYDMKEDRVIENKTMPYEDVAYLFGEAEKCGLHIQTYTWEYVLAKKDTRELRYYVDRTTTKPLVTEDIFSVLKEEPNKVLLVDIDHHERLVKFRDDHAKWALEHATTMFSCPQYLEYCPLNSDKGEGLRFIRNYLGVDKQNTYAVGDEQNDISMIHAAGTGIAMKNGVEETKAAADYVTEQDNEHDAIAEIIEKFILD